MSEFELFDHTADIGVRVRAATRAALVGPAVQGLYATIGVLVPTGPTDQAEFRAADDEPALLLRDYLDDLLAEVETHRRIASRVDVQEFSDRSLHVVTRLARIDQNASALEREVKAITYHELDIRQTADGWQATFIVDI